MEELKQLRQWVCWNRKRNRKGKVTKVPCSASGGPTGVDAAHRDTLVTYEEARAAAEKRHYSGTGFVIPEGTFMLDIDDREVSDPLVQEILRICPVYAEVSVSNHGIHLIGKCTLERIPTQTDRNGRRKLGGEFYVKNPRNKIELYIGGLTDRYATYSGKVICDLPVADCTDALLEILDRYMRRDPAPDRTSAKDPLPDSDADETEAEAMDIIASLRRQKNGGKFSRLYDRGDLSGYNSQSEADQALCNLIAYRAGNRPELIEAIFRSSALYREKWEREDYREATVRKAIEACGAGADTDSRGPFPPFIRFTDCGKPTVSPTLLASYIRKTEHILLVQDSGKQGTLTYVYENGCYRLYTKDRMLGLIKAPVEAFDERLLTYAKITEAYNLLMTDRERVTQDQLNADEHLINFRNGLLRIAPDGLTLLPHSPDVYSTIQIPCDWTGEEIPTPVFDSYLQTLTDGDDEVARLLLEVMGVILSNVKCWRMKKALFLAGPGDTGKSVLKSLVERILGSGNYIGIDLQGIEARFGTGAIYNTRLAGSSDMSFMTIGELKTFKQLTGGDSVFAEFKGQQSFEYVYSGFLFFCMNKVPKFGGDDGQWVYDRMMVVNCRNVIPKELQDKELLDKLYAEREGILFKAVRALQSVLANGNRFSEPASVAAARDDYQQVNNSVIGFFHECMCGRTSFDKSDECTVTEVYDAYRTWCRDNNNGYTKTKKEFRETLAEHLSCSDKELVTHTERGTCYKSITLTPEAKRQVSIFAA